MTDDDNLIHRGGLVFDRSNAIHYLHLPYVFAGGRDPAHPFLPWDALPPAEPTGKRGYDCSSALSAALHAGGLLSKPPAAGPLDTHGFEDWGVEGLGELITVAVEDRDKPTPLDHCAMHFNAAAAAPHGLHWNLPAVIRSGGWWQFTHTGGPTGWVGFDSTGFKLRHYQGL